MNNKKKLKISMIIGIALMLLLVVGATYAYFQITATNSATNTTTTGTSESVGITSLSTNVSNLYINLNALAMSEENIGNLYYATTDLSGTPITNATLGNGIYTLATASVSDGDAIFNCNYSYDLTATLTSPITDGSDEDIKVTLKGSSITGGVQTYTLKQLITGTQTLNGTFSNLGSTENQTITIESTVENTSDRQNDFVGNSFTLTISPKTGSDGFSCLVAGSNPQYRQLVNYTMLYDAGNEHTDITGGWDDNHYSTDYSYINCIKKANHIYINDTSTSAVSAISTNRAINLSQYSEIRVIFSTTSHFYLYASTPRNIVDPGYTNVFGPMTNSYSNKKLNLDLSSLNSDYYYTLSTPGNRTNEAYIYNIYVIKADNYQTLCEKAGITPPADIATLLTNTTSLTAIFNNRDAVNYMARQCTGDFMADAVQSATFKSALSSSPYKNIIENNEHWAKFLAMTT